MNEHRVKVDGGMYEFVRREDGTVDVTRGGEPWLQRIMPQVGVGSMMAELDAARVVVQAARLLVELAPLTAALLLHDRLVSDREPPSAWCGVRPDPDAMPSTVSTEKCPRCRFAPCRKMFQCSEQGGYRFVDAELVGYVSNARLAEIGRCAAVNSRDLVLTTAINSKDLQLVVGELQRRRGHEQDDATYRAFKAIDTAATVTDLEALLRSLAGKLSPADRADAERRYYQRKAWLESQANASSQQDPGWIPPSQRVPEPGPCTPMAHNWVSGSAVCRCGEATREGDCTGWATKSRLTGDQIYEAVTGQPKSAVADCNCAGGDAGGHDLDCERRNR